MKTKLLSIDYASPQSEPGITVVQVATLGLFLCGNGAVCFYRGVLSLWGCTGNGWAVLQTFDGWFCFIMIAFGAFCVLVGIVLVVVCVRAFCAN